MPIIPALWSPSRRITNSMAAKEPVSKQKPEVEFNSRMLVLHAYSPGFEPQQSRNYRIRAAFVPIGLMNCSQTIFLS